MAIDWIRPDWHAPPGVAAASTTRHGGVSRGPWSSLNLGDHVGDDSRDVAENRRRLARELDLPGVPAWLRQVHGSAVRQVEGTAEVAGDRCADACCSASAGGVCVVMTADCLPVLFCNRAGTRVAAAHAGWRGLLAGVLENTLDCFDDPPGQLIAWLGPAIGPAAFEVGDEVRDLFIAGDPASGRYFEAHGEGHWMADIYGLARHRLGLYGVGRVSGGGFCTYSEPARFFSYRREGITGRMATLVWLES